MVGRHPQNNLNLRTEAGYGVEWTLAPFVRAGEANVGIRLNGAVFRDEYVAPNIENREGRTTFRPGANAFARIHYDRVDIETSFWASFAADRQRFGRGVATPTSLSESSKDFNSLSWVGLPTSRMMFSAGRRMAACLTT